MSNAADEELKLKALGFLQVDSSPSRLRELMAELGVSYSKLLKWRRELVEANVEGDILSLVNADKLMLHRVAEEVKTELEELAPKEGKLIEAAVDEVIDGVEGLNVLSEKLQKTAIKLASKVDGLASSVLEPKDINVLVDALAKLQIAFFSKTTNTINVQQNTYSNEGVSKFAGLEKKI